MGLTIGGRKIVYDAGRKTLEGMPLPPVDGKIHIELLVDRPSLEICGNQGRVYQTCEFRAAGPIRTVQAWSDGAAARLLKLEVYELKSAWGVKSGTIAATSMVRRVNSLRASRSTAMDCRRGSHLGNSRRATRAARKVSTNAFRT